MKKQVRLNSILGLAVMFGLLAYAPQPSFASCKNSGGSSGSSKFGSQVNGGSVTICAAAVAVTPARSAVVNKTVKVVAKTVSKPVSKSVSKTMMPPKPAAKAVFRKTPSPKVATKPVVKVVSKSVVKKKTLTKMVSKPSVANKTSAMADFTPASVFGAVYPSTDLSVGQQASFVSSAVQHYRTGSLLGLPTEVRFTPVQVLWNFGDGSGGSGSYAPHAFDSAGVHQIEVRVVYAISYRVKGSIAWIAEPDTITLADDLQVQVSAGSQLEPADQIDAEAGARVLLVGQDCLSKPGSFGCN